MYLYTKVKLNRLHNTFTLFKNRGILHSLKFVKKRNEKDDIKKISSTKKKRKRKVL